MQIAVAVGRIGLYTYGVYVAICDLKINRCVESRIRMHSGLARVSSDEGYEHIQRGMVELRSTEHFGIHWPVGIF